MGAAAAAMAVVLVQCSTDDTPAQIKGAQSCGTATVPHREGTPFDTASTKALTCFTDALHAGTVRALRIRQRDTEGSWGTWYLLVKSTDNYLWFDAPPWTGATCSKLTISLTQGTLLPCH